MEDDEILFDASAVPLEEFEREERIHVDHIAKREGSEVQYEKLLEQVEQMKVKVGEYQSKRVESTAEIAMLQKQVDHQVSVVNHLKQMLKNISDKYTACQHEMKSLKCIVKEKQDLLDLANEKIASLTIAMEKFTYEESRWNETTKRLIDLQIKYDISVTECSEWRAKAEELVHVLEENTTLQQFIASLEQEQRITSKRTHHIIKELRQSLKEEQEKKIFSQQIVKCIFLDGVEDLSATSVIQDMASRMEQLLSQNALLLERISFTQENVQLLCEDLERKRQVIQQLTLNLNVNASEQMDIVASAIASASALESAATCETLMYVTIKENLLLKKDLSHKTSYAITWNEPQYASFYRML